MDLWPDILQWAVHTPSPHNVQPWKFKLTGPRSAFLYLDRKRMLPKEDLTGCFILSAMTLMTESLSLLAANRQHRLIVKNVYRDQGEELIPFAELSLQPDPSIQGEYPDSLFISRRTSRLAYDPRPIPREDFQKLEALAADCGAVFGHTEDGKTIEKVLQWNIQALFNDLNDPSYQEEIAGYFRSSDRETRRLRDGLDYRCMNMLKSEMWICKKAPFLLKAPLLHPFLRWSYRRRLGPVGTLGWLSGPFWKPEEAMGAGKALMRFWLETARRGLYFHPFGNLVTNPEAYGKVRRELKDGKIWILFKMGYSAEPPASLRLPVEQILLP